jgi:hypothetical protein
MAETKEDIAAARDALQRENEQLRGQLAAAGAGRAYQPAAQFVLSEGNRQELLAHGVTVIGGRRVTRDEVEAAVAGNPAYDGVDLGDTDPVEQPAAGRRSAGVLGVDFIYPSVAPGYIDPAVAGTPGINGPPATEIPALDNDLPPEVPLEFAGEQA